MKGKHYPPCNIIKVCICTTCAKDSDECCRLLHGDDCPVTACEHYERETDEDA